MKASVRLVRFATIGTLNYLITMLAVSYTHLTLPTNSRV